MRLPATALSVSFLFAFSAQGAAVPDGPVFEKGRDIRPLLERNAGLEAEAIRDGLRKRELRKTAYLAMRIDEPGEECVARDPRTDACLVSVETFNRTLESWGFSVRDMDPEFPTAEDAKRERSALLRSLLEEKYLETNAPDGQARDSLHRLFDSTRSERIQAFRARRGDSAYRALYKRHFAAQFQGREKRRYLALASSDSAWADSLRLAAPDLPEGADRAGRRPPSPPWRRMEEDEMPPELLPAATGLKPGETAGPLRTPYGHVFLRLHSARRTPDVGFEAAMPALISLLHAPSGQEKRLEEAVDAYYARNAADFMAPDTVLYRAWLQPDAKRRGGAGKAEWIREDTSRVAPVAIQDVLLPRALREELDLYRPVRPGELLGPIRSLFGTWYFQPLEIRKGSRRLSLAESRPRIRELLYGKSPLTPEASALRESEAKDRDIWKNLVGDYLLQNARKAPADKSRGEPAGAPPEAGDTAGVASIAETYRKLERDKEEWMRKRVQVRFVEWPG